MTSRKYNKITKKLNGAVKLLRSGTDDEVILSKTIEDVLLQFTSKYEGEHFEEEAKVRLKDEIPENLKLAFLFVNDELKYGVQDTISLEGGFDSMITIKKSKKLVSLIERYGAPVIHLKIGLATRAVDRAHKIAHSSGYRIKAEGTEYVMVKEGYSTSETK